jgi:hypothetical protein
MRSYTAAFRGVADAVAAITPQQFVAKWRGDTRKERSVAQENSIDLCRMLGHATSGDTRDGSLAFAARRRGAGQNDWRQAQRFIDAIERLPAK